ncbi:MAG: DM13 domain-containing protein [Actinobacteria bacterium]|nr:DM13 domain-containing protein [Actinomycetota bacterium]
MRWIRTHRVLTASIAVAALAIGSVAAFGYFEVQTAFIDDTVAQTAPVGADERAFTGMFEGREHDTSGTALVLVADDGSRFVRFESFATSNGPDVRVFLAPDESGVADAVDLGPLQGNVGDQNYAIPEGTDLATLDTVLVWCVRFDALFGAAALDAV